MHFAVSHTFDGIDVVAFENLYFDESFNEAMCRDLHLGRKLLQLRRSATAFERKVLVQPERDIPKAVQKVLGDQNISYIETIRYDLTSHAGTWVSESSVLSEKIHSRGTLAIIQEQQGVERQVTGDVFVRIFGIGGLIERFIVADVTRGYALAAKFTADFLQQSTGA